MQLNEQRRSLHARAIREIIWHAGVALLFLGITLWTDAADGLGLLLLQHRSWHLDELILMPGVLLALFTIFSWRRWRELSREVVIRAEAQQALQAAHQQLEQRVEERTAELHLAKAMLEEELGERKRAQAILEESESRFRSLIRNASDVFALVENDWRIRYCNEAVAEILGYAPSALTGVNLISLINPEDVEIGREMQKRTMEQSGGNVKGLLRLRHADGSWRTCEAIYSNAMQDPAVAAIVVTLSDVTEQKRASDAVADREARLRLLLEQVPAILWSTDAELKQTSMSGAGLQGLVEIGCNEFDDSTLCQFLQSKDLCLQPKEPHERALGGESVDFELEGLGRHFQCGVEPFRDQGGTITGVIGVALDITERKENERQWEYKAHHDQLTGLPNRTSFLAQLRAALREGHDVAMLYLDLDNFKWVNDSLGHNAGDLLLIQIANRLQRIVGTGGMIARFGGDEFAVLLNQSAPTTPNCLSHEIFAQMREPFHLYRNQINATFSIGSTIGTHGDRPEDLLRQADIAMYRAKRSGKAAHVAFEASMQVSVVERVKLEGELQRALDQQEFLVYYQPIVDLTRGEIVGLEALVRWKHPDRGIIMPDAFIPLAEETGQITALDRLVVTEACRQFGQWQLEFSLAATLFLAVNLSARHFQNGWMLSEMVATLEQTDMDLRRILLEVTENTMMVDSLETMERMQRLRQLGVGLALDDFGKGFSSLGYLKQFPVDGLKIDRSFIAGLGIDGQETAIVETIVAIGKKVGLTVTAEGIETKEQLGLLKALGCERGQGYLFSKPLANNEIEQILASGNPVPQGEVHQIYMGGSA